jgi:hypothetical protein
MGPKLVFDQMAAPVLENMDAVGNAVIQEQGKLKYQEVHVSRLKSYFSSPSGVENAAA